MDYESFKERVQQLYDQGIPTSGDPDGDIPLLSFTRMNLQRMKRGEKQIELKPEVKKALHEIPEEWYWVVLVEGWCGDVAQNLPAIARLAEESPKVELKLILRDQNLDIMDRYLTNGGRSIPVLICLRAKDLQELGSWGPRPAPVQKMVMELKDEKEGAVDKKKLVDEYHEKMHKWYAEDKSNTIQEELLEKIREWEKATEKVGG